MWLWIADGRTMEEVWTDLHVLHGEDVTTCNSLEIQSQLLVLKREPLKVEVWSGSEYFSNMANARRA